MKKAVKLILVFIMLIMLPITACAQTEEDYTQTEEYKDMVEEITGAIDSAADDEINEVLDEQGIDVENGQGVSDISIKSVINSVVDSFLASLKAPIKMLGKIIAICVLCMLAQSLAPNGSGVVKSFRVISILCSVTVMYEIVYASFDVIKNSLDRMSTFMLTYIPIFSSVTATSGNMASGGSYYAITLVLCEIIAVISNNILIPFLSVVLAVSLVSAINPELNFCGAANSIKKCVQWILGGLMTIFVGLLTIQSLAGTATDSLTSRTIKFAAASFIPIIGGVVSEAYSTVYGSLGVIRSGAGTIGIIAICIIVLQPIVTILAIKLTISLGKIITEIFEQNEASEFLNSTNAVLSIGLSVVICFSLIFIIATAVLMMTAINITG